MRLHEIYKTLIILCLLFLETPELFSQDPNNTIGKVSISTPNAASLGKYGDIPVSYHTGAASVNIPVYTAESGSLKVPVGLSYHASGIKVAEAASWVGTGWALNAGGMITRTVMGGPDDLGFKNYQGYTNYCLKGYYTDYGYQSYLITPGSDSSTWSNQLAVMDDYFRQGIYDGEPDLYFFNFNGHSGKFYFNDDRTPVVVPEDDLLIQPDYELGPGFKGFTITTNDGVKYFFGRTGNYSSAVDPVEWSVTETINNGASTSGVAASGWYLNKIMSADGMDSVTFQYATETFSNYNWSMFPVTMINPTNQQQTYGVDLVKNITSGVRLTKIIFANGTIVFNPAASTRTDLSDGNASSMTDATNTSSRALGSILISNSNGYCKKDSLYYGYFVDNTTDLHNTFWGTNLDVFNLHTDKSRLRLDSIQETACDQTIKVPPYKFTYFTDFVPRRLSFGVDHWGYYNGIDYNVGLVPTYTQKDITGLITQKQGANRDAAFPAMRAATLQTITYPTGGSSTMDFEAHDTHLNYYTYVANSMLSMSVGFTNPTTDAAYNFHFDGNAFQIIVQDNHDPAVFQTSYTSLQITNSSNATVFNSGEVINAADTFNQVLTAGDYVCHIHKEYPTTGHGGQAWLNEWIATATNSNVMVGGLRIKTETNFDPVSGQSVVTNYNYKLANLPTGNSTGILYSRPTYASWIRNYIFELVYGIHPLCDYPGLYLSPSSVRPMATTQGNHIGYNEVFVSQSGNGYSDYQYYGSDVWDYNVDDVCSRYVDATSACSPTIYYLPAVPLPFEFKRGELKYEGHFNESGNVLKSAYYYPVFATDSLYTVGHVTANLPNGIASYSDYLLQSARKIQTRKDESYFAPGGLSVTNSTTTYFGSKYHLQPTRVVSNTSSGDSLIDKISYAFDYRPSQFTTPDSLNYFLTLLKADSSQMFINFNSCPAGELSDIDHLLNSCHHSRFEFFRGNTSKDRLAFINYRRRTFTDAGSSYASAHATAKSSADSELKPIFELQDAFQNPAIESSHWKNSNLLHANFTRYDYVSIPAGSVYPNKTQLINLQAPSSTFTASAVSTNSLTKDSRYLDESVYKFNAGNPQEVTPHDGVTNSYIWDYQNTQPIAKVINTTSDQIAHTSFEADGKGGWTFTGATSADTTAITGSRDYSLSGGNITKSGLNTAKSFVVSYWSKSGSALVNGASATSPISKRGWNYYEHVLTAGISTVTVSGSVVIDELRLYPSDAQMTTYTYTPLLGITSSCDVNNRITYYCYDTVGRLRWIKDQDGNIVKTIQYHYFNQTTAQ